MLDRRSGHAPQSQGGVLSDDGLYLDDDAELELYRSAPSPWAEGGEGLEPHPPPHTQRKPLGKPAPGPGSARIRVVVNTGKPPRPAGGASQHLTTATDKFLPLLSNASAPSSPRQTHVSSGRIQRGRDASPLVHAYQSLIEQSDAMTTSFEANSARRRLHQAALQLGIEQLSTERVKQQQRAIRFNTLKNEVDIFQQCLDPFIFEMRTPHEHDVNSSVYRHFTRMQGVQDLGIPIYSLGNYLEDDYDRILTARTTQKFYRRIRRHDAAHYIDTELIPRPAAPSRRKPTTRTTSSASPAPPDSAPAP